MLGEIKTKFPALKNVSSDFLLNLLATFVSTGVMQLVLYPQLALHMDDEHYGGMLTAMGVVNILALSFGNNLCNARIVLNEKYKKDAIVGDFQLLALISVAVTVAVVCLSDIYFKWPAYILIGIAVLASVTVLKSYYLVTYRLSLNYRQNLWANIVMAAFYVPGSFVLIRYMPWPYVFALPCLAGIGYVACSSDILKEPFVRTTRFRESTKVVTMLILSGIIGNLTMYLDRFIVYPILGGSSVSYYTIAAFFAKSLSMVLLPMTAVLLSYIAADKIRVSGKRFSFINLALLLLSALFLLITITVGYYITAWLYPSLIDASRPYLLLASIGIIIGIAGAFNGVVVLAKAPSYWQLVLSAAKFLLYFVSCIILVEKYGLIGLCWGVLVTNTIAFVANYVVGRYYLRKAI